MPEIPQFTPEPVEIPPDRATASPYVFRENFQAASHLGGALERLGTDTSQIVQQAGQRYFQDNLSDATAAAHDALQNGMDEARQTGNWQGFTDRLKSQLGEDFQKRIENAPTGEASARLKQHFQTLATGVTDRARIFEHGMGIDDALGGISREADASAKRLYRDPSLLADEVGLVKGRIAAATGQGFLNPKLREKTERQAEDQLAMATIRGRQNANDPGLVDDVEKGKYDSFLTPQSLERLQPLIDDLKAERLGRQYSPLRQGSAGGGAGGGNAEVAANNFAGMRMAGVPAGGGPSANPAGWQHFDTPEAGIQGISHQLDLYAQGSPATGGKPLNTVRQIVSTWAPPSENPTAQLIARASQVTGLDPDQPIDIKDPATKAKLIEALIRNEQGGKLPVDPAVITKVVGAAPPATGADSAPPQAPDLDKSIAAIEGANGYSDKQKDRAIAIAARDYHHWQQATAQDRAALESDVKNGIAALSDGRDWQPDPVAIKQLLPAEKADETLRAIDEAREVGNIKNQVWFASPEDLNALVARGQAMKNSPQDYARAQRYNQQLFGVIKQREDALAADPAAYVHDAPAVAAAQGAVDPQKPDPAAVQGAVAATLAEEARLGVPEEKRAALSKPQAANLVSQIVTADPAKTDIGGQLDGLVRLYGPQWNRVFGDLVRAGLPPEAQLLGAMDTPDQAAARGDFQQMLKLVAEKGGVEELKKAAGKQPVTDIENALDGQMAAFRKTVPDAKLYDAVRNGVEHLAQFYAFRGMNGDQALSAAYDGIIARKYDFDGMIRAPKGQLGTVQRAGDQALAKLTAGDFADLPGNPDLTPERRREIYLDAVKNGVWATNKDDTGIVRLARFRDGTILPARRADGSPIEVKFSDAARLAGGAVPPAADVGASGTPF